MLSLIKSIGYAAVIAATAAALSPAAAQKAADGAVVSKEGYQIGPDDVIEVDVLGQQDFRTRARIKDDGTIPLPFLGSVSVRGQTPTALAAAIAGRLKSAGVYANPVVNVEVVSYASRYVIVLGEAGSSGLVPVDRSYRLSEIMARVGGIKPSGAPYVVLNREGQPARRLPFENLARGTDEDDPLVAPGDKIFVPRAELYYVYGAINKPGEFAIADDLSVRKALARAGGVSPTGSMKRIKIFRDGKEVKKIDLERAIEPGDVIVVGERLF